MDNLKVLFCGIITCSLHFDKTLRINYEKYDEKNVMISDTCYDQCYDSIIYQIHTTITSTEVLKG